MRQIISIFALFTAVLAFSQDNYRMAADFYNLDILNLTGFQKPVRFG